MNHMKTFLRYTYLRTRKATYAQDGLITTHNADFLKDPDFVRGYAAGERTGSWNGADIQWRVHVLRWAAQVGLSLADGGDFVECGTNRGGVAMSILEGTDFLSRDKTFWLYDTFEGLVDEQITEAERANGMAGWAYEPCYEAVERTFAPFGKAVRLRKGAIPDTLYISPERVAFLHIDMNCAAPEVAAIEHFWPRLSPGALVILDDYGFRAHIEQKHAMDAFARSVGVTILSLPTGQGMIAKP